jgi:hypothetical protein
MFLVELVLQGVRGLREPARLRFKGGYNLVIAGNESGKTSAIDTMQRLLFPTSQAGALTSLVSRHSPDTSRSALVLYSDDGVYYRIIQDFSKRAVNLSRYNTTSKTFTLLHKDWDSTAKFMASLTAEMTEEDFSRIFVFQRVRPAARPGTSSSAATLQPVSSTPVPSAAGKSSGDREKLAELHEALRKAEEAADAEYKFQSAKLALEEIETKIGSLEEIETKKAELESTLASLKGFEGMPEDLGMLIDAYERLQGQKLADADELDKQIEGVKMQQAATPTGNVFMSKLFIAGAVVGVLSILAGVFVLTEDQALLFPVGILLSLILMAGAWYTGSRKDAQKKRLFREEESLTKELADLEKRFQQEGATVTGYMRSTGASSPAELKEKAESRS